MILLGWWGVTEYIYDSVWGLVDCMNLVSLSLSFFWSTPIYIRIEYSRIHNGKWMIVFEDFRWNRQTNLWEFWGSVFRMMGTNNVSDKHHLTPTPVLYHVSSVCQHPPVITVWRWFWWYWGLHKNYSFCSYVILHITYDLFYT